MSAVERIQTLCARVRAARYPDELVVPLASYLHGRLPRSEITARIDMLPSGRRDITPLLVEDLPGRDVIDEVDLRLLALCRASRFRGKEFLYRIAAGDLAVALVEQLAGRGDSPAAIAEVLLLAPQHGLGEDGAPNGLGRFLLAQIPAAGAPPSALWAAMDTHLRGREQQRPRAAFVLLLLAATPPHLDLAWEYAQNLHDYDRGRVGAALLRVDPARFTDHVRALAAPDPTGARVDNQREEALKALMALDPARHVDLAVAAFHDEHGDRAWSLRLTALKTAFGHDPQAYWHLAEAAVESTSSPLSYTAINLMAEADFPRAIPVLRGYVERHNADQAQWVLRELLLGRAWPGRRAYAVATLSHRARPFRNLAARWLGQQGEAVVPELAVALTHTSADTRLAAVDALRRIDAEAARAALAARLAAERSGKVCQAILDVTGPLVPAEDHT